MPDRSKPAGPASGGDGTKFGPGNPYAFKPGRGSANPGGMTKDQAARKAAVIEMAQQYAVDALGAHVAVIERIAEDRKAGVHPNDWPKDWQKSADAILDRAIGKPKQATEVSGDPEAPLEHRITISCNGIDLVRRFSATTLAPNSSHSTTEPNASP